MQQSISYILIARKKTTIRLVYYSDCVVHAFLGENCSWILESGCGLNWGVVAGELGREYLNFVSLSSERLIIIIILDNLSLLVSLNGVVYTLFYNLEL